MKDFICFLIKKMKLIFKIKIKIKKNKLTSVVKFLTLK